MTENRKLIIGYSAVTKKILEILQTTQVNFAVVEHAPVFTSEDAARIRDTDIKIGAKALILFADKVPVMAVVPADKKLSFKKFKNFTSTKDLRLATTQEVHNLTGLYIGSIPPIGSVFGLPVYFDTHFERFSEVAFNAGSHTVSIKMDALDLVKIENPKISDFATTHAKSTK